MRINALTEPRLRCQHTAGDALGVVRVGDLAGEAGDTSGAAGPTVTAALSVAGLGGESAGGRSQNEEGVGQHVDGSVTADL